MSRKRQRRSTNRGSQGALPGAVSAPVDAVETHIEFIQYTQAKFQRSEVPLEQSISLDPKMMNWIAVDGYQDAPRLQNLAQELKVHPLAVEDAMCAQRPRFVNFETHFMLTFPVFKKDSQEVDFLSTVVHPNSLISLQRKKFGVKPPVMERLSGAIGRIRKKVADYLCYALLDSALDTTFPIVDELTIELEGLDELSETDDFPAERVRAIRKLAQVRRRFMRQTKEAISDLLRHENFVDDKNRAFFRDCQAHAVDLTNEFEMLMELADNQLGAHETFLQKKTAMAMQTLTVVSAIFIPLSFMAGLYGMNFDQSSPWNMPELTTRYGYPVLLSIMVVTAIIMLRYFKRRGLL